MNREHWNILEYLTQLTEADMRDKEMCEMMIRTYIDSGYKMCKTCAPQVVAGFKRLKLWWEKEKVNYDYIKDK
jgi:hypothetical protein